MKLIRKSTVLMLALLLILECFTAPALATVSEDPVIIEELTVAEESVSNEEQEIVNEEQETVTEAPIAVEELEIVSEAANADAPEEETPVPASEEDIIVKSGKCGENLTWTLDRNGLLTISGTGEMTDYPHGTSAPWINLFVKEAIVESGVTSIGDSAFRSSNSFLTDLVEITLPETLVSIGNMAFYNSGIKEISIPDSVTFIGSSAFEGCAIKEVVIPDSVKTIGEKAFAGGTFTGSALTYVQLPKGLTEIPDNMFEECRSLKEITIPETVTKIGWKAFRGCYQLESFNFHGNLEVLEDYAFENCAFTSIRLPDSITSMESCVFENCSKLEEVILPKKLTKISFGLFRHCHSLTSVTIPSTVKTIRTDAFRDCSSLEYIEIPNSVTSIEGGVFMDCTSLVAVQWPTNAPIIGNMTFADCSSLLAIFLPAKLKEIKANAFTRCSNLTEIHYLGTEPQLGKLKVAARGNDSLLNADWYLSTIPTKQPKDVTTTVGKTVKFSTAASRSGCKFQWYYFAPDGTEWLPASGKSAKTATYSFTAKESHDGYWYCCLITDPYDNEIETVPVLLTVVPKPKITKQPESVTAKNGTEVTVTVEAEGEGLKYQWYYAGKKSPEFKKASIKEATYTATMSASCDGRKLYCVITDKYGQSIKTKTVTLTKETTPLVIVQQPESAYAKYGQKATVKVEAEGEGLSYQWYYAKEGATKFTKASIKKATYSVTMDLAKDGRQLYCVIKDKFGKSVKTDVVTINIERTPLEIAVQPVDATAEYSKKATVTVEAQGDGLTYQWYYCDVGSTEFQKGKIAKASYSLAMNASRDGRQVYCIVTDIYGNKITTDTVTLTIDRKELSIVTQPVSVSVKNGKKATVKVVAEGDGLTYQWYYAAKGSSKFKKASVTKATYSAEMSGSVNGRQLYCVVKDAYGNSIQTDVVTIQKK